MGGARSLFVLKFFLESKEKAHCQRRKTLLCACLMTLTTDIYTGLFISPSGISEFDCATTKTDTVERSISIGIESLHVFFY